MEQASNLSVTHHICIQGLPPWAGTHPAGVWVGCSLRRGGSFWTSPTALAESGTTPEPLSLCEAQLHREGAAGGKRGQGEKSPSNSAVGAAHRMGGGKAAEEDLGADPGFCGMG